MRERIWAPEGRRERSEERWWKRWVDGEGARDCFGGEKEWVSGEMFEGETRGRRKEERKARECSGGTYRRGYRSVVG